MVGDDAVVSAARLADDTPVTELIARYRSGVAVLRDSVAGLTREQWLARPVAGKLSTAEVVAHVADCEQFMADRMKRTISEDRPLIVGVDQDAYFAALGYQRRASGLDLALVEATREQMAADLERLDAAAWQRTAVHTETGLVTLRQLLLHSIRHLDRHVEAIREKREAMHVEA